MEWNGNMLLKRIEGLEFVERRSIARQRGVVWKGRFVVKGGGGGMMGQPFRLSGTRRTCMGFEGDRCLFPVN